MAKRGSYYIKKARENGLEVEQGRGSHVKVYAPNGRGYMTIPDHPRDLATGTENAIKKWFKALGILVVLCAAIYIVYYV